MILSLIAFVNLFWTLDLQLGFVNDHFQQPALDLMCAEVMAGASRRLELHANREPGSKK